MNASLSMPRGPFTIPSGDGLIGSLPPSARTVVERVLGLPRLNHLYRQIAGHGPADSFASGALKILNITYHVPESDLRRIPSTGPIVVVANHPFGAIDGLILADLIQKVRPDGKLLANELLTVMPEMRQLILPLNVLGDDGASHNFGAVRGAIRWLESGHALGVFPAGEVSHLRLRERGVSDGPWNENIARIIRRSNATVVPVFFDGHNSAIFQLAGLVHPRLRTALLPRELLARRHTTIRVHVGQPIPPQRLASFDDDQAATAYLRVRTYILRGRTGGGGPGRDHVRVRSPRLLAPVAAPEDAATMRAEVAGLPQERCLAGAGNLRVHYASAWEIPVILREIGRLRELTFRGVGEGSGKQRDLDRFDDHYLHLFVWNQDRREVVGAYRIGLLDQIARSHGHDGLYTSTLFRFRQPLLDKLAGAMELGRSFVRDEYQREFAPLMLLWKGIAHFAAKHPRYRYLFGPVSISNDYSTMTKRLLVAFLKVNRYASALGELIRPRRPFRAPPAVDWDPKLAGTIVQDIDEMDRLVAEIESDRRSVPVLLRQYLKLNAKLLGFNVDPDFGDVLDALMLVDLTQVPHPILARYMGSESMKQFLAHHAAQPQ